MSAARAVDLTGAAKDGGAAAGIVALLQQLRDEHLASEAEDAAMLNPETGREPRVSDAWDEEGEALAALRKALASTSTLAR